MESGDCGCVSPTSTTNASRDANCTAVEFAQQILAEADAVGAAEDANARDNRSTDSGSEGDAELIPRLVGLWEDNYVCALAAEVRRLCGEFTDATLRHCQSLRDVIARGIPMRSRRPHTRVIA